MRPSSAVNKVINRTPHCVVITALAIREELNNQKEV